VRPNCGRGGEGRGGYGGFSLVYMYYKFIGLAYQGLDIVFRFIIEYSSLMDFGPLGNNFILLYEDF